MKPFKLFHLTIIRSSQLEQLMATSQEALDAVKALGVKVDGLPALVAKKVADAQAADVAANDETVAEAGRLGAVIDAL